MRVPKSVYNLLEKFHQDIFVISGSVDEGIASAIDMLPKREAIEAKAFLTKLLDGTHSGEDIKSVWNSAPKDIRIDGAKDIRKVLEELRDRLPSA